MSGVLLQTENLVKVFGAERALGVARAAAAVRAVDGVSFTVAPGETLAVVGESGCGKSSLGRLLLRLIEPTEGRVTLKGQEITALSKTELRLARRHMQMVFQDPYGSLSPRRRIAQIIAEPLNVFGAAQSRREQRDRVAGLLELVGLSPTMMDRYPNQFSGGQRQRIGIARAIALDPALIVADEPVSALDVSVQAQIINLLQDLQAKKGFSYLFISHNLAVVQHIADRVAVMYLGRIVEIGPKREVYSAPHHPYTQALLSAVPDPDPDVKSGRIVLSGDVPSPTRIPSGCSFRTRCPLAQDVCAQERPPLRTIGADHQAACHFAAANPIR
jgi:peptide/nickel transport system ATP-binding protein/oligopeptide transport system ATP-binding protein